MEHFNGYYEVRYQATQKNVKRPTPVNLKSKFSFRKDAKEHIDWLVNHSASSKFFSYQNIKLYLVETTIKETLCKHTP